MSNILYGAYNTPLLVEVWGDATAFLLDYKDCGIPVSVSDEDAKLIYYLLYSKYGNTPIASTDTTRFKYAVMATIFEYGPTWTKKREIQKAIREIPLDELLEGSSDIYNHAYNPSSEPSTQTLEELNFINEQNTRKHKRNKIDAYAMVLDLLQSDLTSQFIGRFNKLFMSVVSVQNPVLYTTDDSQTLEV